jgi:hypothetical protein
MVAGNHPIDLEAALQFELKLLDRALANIFDFLNKMEGKDDIAVACALARQNVAMFVETAAQKLSDQGGESR